MPKAKRKAKQFPRLVFLKRFSNQQVLIVAGLLAIVGLVYIVASLAAGPSYDNSPNAYDSAGQALLKNDPAHGLNYDGLKLVKKNANHPCKGIFEVVGTKANGKPLCSHGPDPAPDDTDISQVTPEKRLARLEKADPNGVTANDLVTGPNTLPYVASNVPCTTGGYRIQLVLVTHSTDNAAVRSQLVTTAQRLETQLEYSSTHSGPGSTIKRLRFVTNASCVPTVITLITPDGYSLASSTSASDYVYNRGYRDPHTKYLIWDYAGGANFCGTGTIAGDSQASITNNLSNRITGYAVIAPGCWDSSAEMHELMHTLGAVSLGAPHTTGAYHCLDQHDEMCYPDKTPDFKVAANGQAVYIAPNCTDPSFAFQLDCNKNDYFNSGSVSSTNFLYNHWNVANSPYFQ